MTLNQLYYFQTLANLENFHKAAEKLYISQPSLSRSMDALEKELGVLLFEKRGRGVSLTKAGLVFLSHADQILSECGIAAEKMQELAGGSGRIDIGYVYPLAGHYIPHKVRKFLNQVGNDGIIFNFYQNHTPDILSKVRHGELDIGFGMEVDKEEDVECFPIIDRKMLLITPVNHPLAGQKAVSVRELEKYPVIGYDHTSGLGIYTRNLYRQMDLHPNITVECPDEHSIVALVEEEFGIALVPMVENLERKRVVLLSFTDVNLVNRNYMFWMKDRYHLPVVSHFIDFMKKECREPDIF